MNWNDVFNQPVFSIIDFETSGLSPEVDYIIEAGLLEARDDRRNDALSWIINPNFPNPFHITQEVTLLTGINDTKISNGADGSVFFPSLLQRIKWNPVWGHNLSRFDSFFIAEECKRTCTIPPSKKTWYDTAAVFKAYRLTLPDQKWKQEPHALEELEDYPTFYDWVMYILSKPIKGLYYNLPFCCKNLGIDTTLLRFHRAGADVIATDKVREALKKIILQ